MIVLIDPPGITKGFNSGLAYLSACLKENRIRHKIIDLNNNASNAKKRLNIVKEADFVGISIKTGTLANAIKIARIIKKINPKARLIAGGVHISVDGLQFMKENELFDYAFSGECEDELPKLIKGKKLKEIGNLYYRTNNKVRFSKSAGFIENLNKLPFPSFKEFDSIKDKINFYPLTTSRGCPFQCIYCSVPQVIGRRWRARALKGLINELRLAKKEYNIKGFEILDDNFTLDRERAKRFCELLLKEEMHLKWCCSNGLRADTLDEELTGLMKKSGCFSISLGIESGHPEVFKNVNKGEGLEQIADAIKLLKKYKIETFGYFIIGLPGSSYKKDMDSVRYCKKLGIKGAFNILVPYPTTPLWNLIVNNQGYRMLRDWREGLHFGTRLKVVFDTKEYPAKERIKAYHKANLRVHSYGTFLEKNKSLLRNFLSIIKKIAVYDPLYSPYHLFWLFRIYLNYRKKFVF